jgi:hypothetical protein
VATDRGQFAVAEGPDGHHGQVVHVRAGEADGLQLDRVVARLEQHWDLDLTRIGSIRALWDKELTADRDSLAADFVNEDSIFTPSL